MTTSLFPVTPPVTPPGPPVGTGTCTRCEDSGWADPFDVHAGSPPFTWCDACLGSGLEDCTDCDGYGAVPEPTPCPDCDVTRVALAA